VHINHVPPLVALGWSFLILLLFFTAQILASVLADEWLALTSLSHEQRQWGVLCSAIIGGGSIGLVAVWLLCVKGKTALIEFSMPPLAHSLFYLLLAIGINLLFQLMFQIFDWHNHTETTRFLLSGITNIWTALLVIGAVVLVAPLFEEILFRGYLFKHLHHSRLGSAGALIMPNALWTIIHITQYDFIELLMIFSAGMLFGWARLKTKHITTAIMMHMTFNTISLISY
jgi:hypothetical protein